MKFDYDEISVTARNHATTIRMDAPFRMFEAMCDWYWEYTKPETYYLAKEQADQALLAWCKEHLPVRPGSLA